MNRPDLALMALALAAAAAALAVVCVARARHRRRVARIQRELGAYYRGAGEDFTALNGMLRRLQEIDEEGGNGV